ncbi:hypothetical protein [Pontiella sp.]|uniref:hypothetical protein n=1 Tax=Pontiella sp. TaxID=2837462 RepID=UPI003563E705
MIVVLLLMLIAAALPLIQSIRSESIWERMLCYTSISTRFALILILYSRVQHDPMIGLVAVVVLSVGNSGLLLLANLFKAMETECE